MLNHWDKYKNEQDRAKSDFLRDVRRSAYRLFRVVLTPDFNSAHKDHFHLDQGSGFSCH